MQVFVIAQKDFYQFLKKWQTFIFLLIMPVIFMFIFGNAFGSPEEPSKPVLLVASQGDGVAQKLLLDMLESSDQLTIEYVSSDPTILEQTVLDSGSAAGLFLPSELDETLWKTNDFSGIVWAAGSDNLLENQARTEVNRLVKRVQTLVALSRAKMTPEQIDDEAGLIIFQTHVSRLANDLLSASVNLSIVETASNPNPYSQSAPGMMLQFAVAGLTGVAAILVLEKSGRTEARMRMTGVPAWQVMLGHFTAITWLLGMQFVLLLLFGQVVLSLDYLSALPATLLLSLLTVFCISALGLLIGVVSHSEEQTVVYAMLCMFVLSGLGGLWMPLDVTGKAFQTLGHLTPLAWAMDGYKAILTSSAGLSEIAPALLILGGYTLGLLALTVGVYAQKKARAR
jgi:ABC-2 type transport system permease protein